LRSLAVLTLLSATLDGLPLPPLTIFVSHADSNPRS
jgi:hypothetical protein